MIISWTANVNHVGKSAVKVNPCAVDTNIKRLILLSAIRVQFTP